MCELLPDLDTQHKHIVNYYLYLRLSRNILQTKDRVQDEIKHSPSSEGSLQNS